MQEYQSNSHKSKESKEKKISKVVTGEVRTKKKSDIQKIADVFISEDIGTVKSYILLDVLIPSIKKAIDDIVSNGIHMLLYNGDKRSEKRSSISNISYSGFYKGTSSTSDRRSDHSRREFDFDDIIFNDRGDAETVLSAMDDIIEQYGEVSVLDLFDLAEVSTSNYAAQKYGWTDLQSARVVRAGDGYIIKLPKARPLN